MIEVLTTRRRRAPLLLLLFFAVSPALPVSAQERPEPSGGASQLSLEVRRRTFDLVWQKISDSFYDPAFKGTDWHAVRAKYLPEVASTSDSAAFHGMLNRMLDEIKESHLSVNLPASPQTGVGLDRLAWAEGKILVAKVEADSPAGKAGIRIGDEVVAVDGSSAEEIYRRAAHDMTFASPELRAQQRPLTVERKLRGAPGSTVKLQIRAPRKGLRELTLSRSVIVTHDKIEPASFRTLTPGVGYIRIPSYWTGNLRETFDEALQQLSDCTGLIVDVRGNSGGQAALTAYLAGKLMEDDGVLGIFIYRHKREPLAFRGSGEKAFKGKVVVLVDEHSASASELFAGGLQDLGRAKVIGNRSGGAVIASLIEPLPTGGSLLYPIADVLTPGGRRLEGVGVRPDVEVKRTRRGLIEGRDVALEKAVAVASVN